MGDERTVNKTILVKPKSIWRVIDLFFPPFCCNCGRIGFEICPVCFSKIETTINLPICDICGRVLSTDNTCPICENSTPLFDQARSWGIYNGVLKKVIQQIKYKRGFGVIEYLIDPLIEFLENWKFSTDVIVPIPLGKKREKERGYNQSALFANPISKHFHVPVENHALTRIRETRSQVGLNYKERKANLKGAFRAEWSIVKNKSILIIDDIATTCATLNESASTLKNAGASRVICFSVAQTKIANTKNE